MHVAVPSKNNRTSTMCLIRGIFLIVMLLCCTQLGYSLRCLACKETLEPWLCTFVRICPVNEENCSVRKYRTLNGEIRYDMDCVTNKICSTSNKKRNILTNRSNGNEVEQLCEECCDGDICNFRGCGSSGYPQERGLMCYSCDQVRDPNKCDKISFCRNDQLCAVYEEQVLGTTYFSNLCNPIFDCNIQQPAIGKRQLIRKRCGTCCNTDFCNTNCEGEIIPSSTESAGTQTTSNPTMQNSDDHKEFVLVYPYFSISQNMYVFMTTTTSGVVLVEVPHLSMKKNVTLNVGRNYLTFNNTMMTRNSVVEHKGIYLKSTVPLSVSVMFDYRDNGGNASTRNEYTAGYMVLPVSRLGKQYVAVTYDDQQFTIAAIHDNTTVRIQIKFPYSSSYYITIAGQKYHSGSTVTMTMNRLDTMCISYYNAMTGTTVFADKDIALLSGNYYYPSYDGVALQYLSPVSQWGNSFFIPSFRKIPGYYMYLQMAEIGGNTTVNVTSTKGTNLYQITHTDFRRVLVDSPPVYIESRKPIQVTIFTYLNSSLPLTMLWIPSTDQYRNRSLISNPNSVTPGQFDEYLYVVIPANKQDGLLVDGLRVHSNEINPTLRVNSSSYAFMTISMDGPYHVITHLDPSVKFGAFVFGEGELLHRFGHSHYGFPAGIQ